MTNWMTAAGIALIAGGIATLICLRSVLFGRGKRSGKRSASRGAQLEQLPARPRSPSSEPEPAGRQPELTDTADLSLPLVRRAAPGEFDRPETPRQHRWQASRADDLPGGLSSIGFADDQPDDRSPVPSAPLDPPPVSLAPGSLAPVSLAPVDRAPVSLAPVEAAPVDLSPVDSAAIDSGRIETAPVGLSSVDASDDRATGPAPVGLAGPGALGGAVDEIGPTPVASEIGDPASISAHAGAIPSFAPVIPSHRAASAEPAPHPLPVTPGAEQSRSIPVRRVDRTDRAYGDRVDGWVRPEYHDDPAEVPSGEYWTPLPMDDLGIELPDDDPEPSARGYGWPTPVERLPAVPDYEPATGFDLTPVASEPTELVPTWPPMPTDRPGRAVDRRTGRAERRARAAENRTPPGETARPELPELHREFPSRPPSRSGPSEEGALLSERASRIRLPHTWAGRNTKPSDNRFLDNEPRRTNPDVDQRFRAPTGEPERRRPRPRPRPSAPPDNVYVSRHAADPPQ